jgi:hypothetical protein
MSPMDRFLQAVENKLRCPVERRPALIEELRGHLTDRATALVAQNLNPAEAEITAVGEMAPAWLLAMRLSLANGWNIFPEILREMGALGLSLMMLLLAAPQLSFVRRIADAGILPINPWAKAAMVVVAGYLITLAALAVFAFYLARLRQSRIWAMIPAFLFFNELPFSWSDMRFFYLAGMGFIIGVIWGAKRPSPRPVWPLMAAAGMALLAGLGVILKVEMAAHLPLSPKMAADYFYGSTNSTAESWFFWGAVSGLLWLGAWILERVHSPSITQAPE